MRVRAKETLPERAAKHPKPLVSTASTTTKNTMTILTTQYEGDDSERVARDPAQGAADVAGSGRTGASGTAACDDPQDVSSRLMLEQLDVDLFRASNLRRPTAASRGAFGGQIIGQALVAALRSIDRAQFVAHSLHGYFLLAGDSEVPALYHVDRLRDGRSFCTRNVVARQGGNAILSMQASFQRPEDSRLAHQIQMPEVPPPMECVDRDEYLARRAAAAKAAGENKKAKVFEAVAERSRGFYAPVELRYIEGSDAVLPLPFPREPKPARLRFWLRCRRLLPDAQWLHQCVAAFFSDYLVASTPTAPHPELHYKLIASLDHSLWFHCPFRADEWMLADYKCDRASGARAITTGHLYTARGELAMTLAQEALYRYHDHLTKPASRESEASVKSGRTAKL